MKTSQLIVAALASLLVSSSGVVLSAEAADESLLDRGRYLVKLGGCNDCHTAGYLLSAGNVPEDQWLQGDSLGWRGAWGTTYATNLRLRLADFTEEEWVAFARQLQARPPMPWFTLNQLEENDLKAIYRFIRHLGPAGNPAPAYVPPDQEPQTPFALFPSPPPAS